MSRYAGLDRYDGPCFDVYGPIPKPDSGPRSELEEKLRKRPIQLCYFVEEKHFRVGKKGDLVATFYQAPASLRSRRHERLLVAHGRDAGKTGFYWPVKETDKAVFVEFAYPFPLL